MFLLLPLLLPKPQVPLHARGPASASRHLRQHHRPRGPRARAAGAAQPTSAHERREWRRQVRAEVLQFGAPALSTVLADPLMSVVDAACVGRCSTLQLASLSPALAVFNFCSYFFFFLNTASCVLVARALAAGDREAAAGTLSAAVAVALSSGLLVGGLLAALAAPLVAATGCVPELVPFASQYLRVRGVGQPAVLVSMVVQAGLLAQEDALTPLQVISFACALNILGDLVLVPKLGAVGAAWATLLAQVASLPLMLLLARSKGRLAIRSRRPRAHELRQLFSTAAPLFFFEMGLSLCYSFIQFRASQYTVTSTAAFQALWAPMGVLAFSTYPLKQAAQVFLPRMTREGLQEVGGRLKTKEFLKVLAGISVQAGSLLAITAVLLARSPQLFSSDQTLHALIKSFAPYVAAIFPVLGMAQACEGLLAGVGDLKFLSLMQVGNVLASLGCLAATKSLGMGVHATWLIWLVFVVARLVQGLARVLALFPSR